MMKREGYMDCPSIVAVYFLGNALANPSFTIAALSCYVANLESQITSHDLIAIAIRRML